MLLYTTGQIGGSPRIRTWLRGVRSAARSSGSRPKLAPRLGIEPSVPALEVLAAHQRPRDEMAEGGGHDPHAGKDTLCFQDRHAATQRVTFQNVTDP